MLEKKVIRGEGIKVPVHKLNSVLQIGDYIITSGRAGTRRGRAPGP